MDPATDVDTCASLVKDTSSDVVQVSFAIVQRNTAVLPAGTPVTPDVAECILDILAVPDTKVQVPWPTDAALPDKVKLPLLQFDWLEPALAAVGASSFVIDTSPDELHVPLVIVQRNTAVVPVGTPVTPEL